MADWDRTYQFPCPPDPGVGSYYTLTVNKPANWTLTSKVGKGTAADPWILSYTTSGEAADTTHGPHNLSKRKAGAEIRSAWLELRVTGGATYKDRPRVRDGVLGGPTPKKATTTAAKSARSKSASTKKGSKKKTAVKKAKSKSAKAKPARKKAR